MSTVDITAEAFPILASRNWINRDGFDNGNFDFSEMSAIRRRVIDGDPFSFWQGSSASDSTTVTLTFSFNKRTAVVSRPLDLIIMQNFNWENFLIESSDDAGTWATVTGGDFQAGTADNAETNLIINVTAGLTKKYIRFSAIKTIDENQKKKIGGITVCNSVLQPASGFLKYRKRFPDRGNIREQRSGHGKIRREYKMRSAASHRFYEATLDFPFSSQSDLDLIRTIEREGFPITWIPQPGDRAMDAYQVFLKGATPDAYEIPIITSGSRIPISLIEAGNG